MPQIEGAAAPKSRSREIKRETALKTALAHAEAELQHPDLMFLGEPQGGRAPVLISEPFCPCVSHHDGLRENRLWVCRPPWRRAFKPSQSSTCPAFLCNNTITIMLFVFLSGQGAFFSLRDSAAHNTGLQ